MGVIDIRLPNGYGSVHKIGGKHKRRNPYRVRVTDGWVIDDITGESKQKFRTLGYFPDRKTAMQALAEYNKNPLTLGTAETTFADVFEMWKREHYPSISPKTQNGYNASFRNSKLLHDIRISEIKPVQLQQVMDAAKPGAKSLLKTFWGQIFKYALKYELIHRDCSAFVNTSGKNDKTERKKEKAPFSKEEIQKLWDNVDTLPGVKLILILIYSGMRPSELLEMKTENVNLEKRIMQGGIKTKAGKDRLIPIHRATLPFIAELAAQGGETLVQHNGKPLLYNRFRLNYFMPVMESLGMNHTAHECRHTGISLMREYGVDLDLLKIIVGHASGDVTDRYLHYPPEMLVDAIDKIPMPKK